MHTCVHVYVLICTYVHVNCMLEMEHTYIVIHQQDSFFFLFILYPSVSSPAA